MAKAPTKAKAKAPAASTNGKATASKRPRLTVGAELTEQEPFLAQIRIDEWATGEYGEQIHLAVKPLEFEVAADKTGMFHDWYKGGTKSNSKCGTLLAKLKEIGIPETTAVGDGELVGTIAWFIRKDMEFGKDRKTGEVLKSPDVLLPHAAPTAEDLARVKDAASKSGNGKAATPEAPEWTDDEIAAVLKVIEGKKQAQFQIAAARSKIAPDLKNAILSGEAVKYLVGLGLIEVGKGGVVASLVEDAADDEEDDDAEEQDDDEDDEEEEEEEGEEDEEDEVPV